MFEVLRSPRAAGESTSRWRDGWQRARDLIGGVLVIVVWMALWASAWAAVAGPLSPAHQGRTPTVEVADAG